MEKIKNVEFLIVGNPKKLNVVRSSLAAETLVLIDTTDDGIYISELISELVFNGVKHIPIKIYTDSKSLDDALKSKKNVTEKRLRIDIAILQKLLELKIVSKLHCIDVRCRLANALMKKGASLKELLDIYYKKEFYQYKFNWQFFILFLEYCPNSTDNQTMEM